MSPLIAQTAEARHVERRERSRLLLAEFEPWLREKLGLISQKTKLAEAIRPLSYLADVLTRIVNGHPNSQIGDLLPWAYVNKHELKAVA